jgi:hypothetical protein
MKNRQALSMGLLAALLMSGAPSVFAEQVRYGIKFNGTVSSSEFVDTFGGYSWYLNTGDEISVYASFIADSSFLDGPGGTIHFNGPTDELWLTGRDMALSLSMADSAPSITFPAHQWMGYFTDFNFSSTGTGVNGESFYSTSLQFHDGQNTMSGEWNPTITELTISPVAAVPEADTYAMLLAGLGLVGYMAGKRRKA